MTLKILSFNIRCGVANDGPNSWCFRKDAAAKQISQLTPDLAGLQEAFDDQNRDLLTRLPDYRMIGVGRDDGILQGEHATILYRHEHLNVIDQGTFWFAETPEIPGSQAWGANLPRICTWAMLQNIDFPTPFALYNLHLDHESQLARENSIRLLIDRIDEEIPSIVTGDFNADELNLAIQMMRDAGFRDTYRIVQTDQPEPGTYHGFSDNAVPGKIDYIWVSPHWIVNEAAVATGHIDDRFPSDHFAIWASLSL